MGIADSRPVPDLLTQAAIAKQVPLETIRNALRSSFVTCDGIGTRAGNRTDDETGS
jgi:hypothetical protein